MRLPPATERTASRAACTRYRLRHGGNFNCNFNFSAFICTHPRGWCGVGGGGGAGSPRLRVRIYRACRHEIHCPVTSLCRSPSTLFACTTGATSWGTHVQKKHRVGACAPPCGYSLFGQLDNRLPRDCRCPSHRGAVDRRNTKRGDATQRTARRRRHCVRLRGPQNFENTRGVSSRSLLLRLPFRLQVHCWTLLAPTRPPGYSRAATAPAAAAATRPRLALHALLPLGL